MNPEFLAQLARKTSTWMALLGLDRRIVWANDIILHSLGTSLAALSEISLWQLAAPEGNDPAVITRMLRQLTRGQGARAEVLVGCAGGGTVWLDADFQPLTNEVGALTGYAVVAADVTAQVRQRQLLSVAAASAGLGTWYWDVANDHTECNDRLYAILGYERGDQDTRGRSWASLIHPDDLEPWGAALTNRMHDVGYAHRMELRVQRADGQWGWVLATGAVVTRNSLGQPMRIAGVCIDINDQKRLEAQLRHASLTDTLTDLPNRKAVIAKLAQSLARGQAEPGYHFAVLFMDFDRFKQVNDTLGHSAGDDLLRQIAQRLEDSLRPGDAFVRTSDYSQTAARIGGDEFVVLLDDIRGDLDAELVAGRLLDVLSLPYQIGGSRVNSTVSIGVVTTEHAAADPDGVLRDADIAMYEAKRAGRGRYVMFEPGMRKRARDDVALENDLRLALLHNELSVVYQPLVDLTTGQFVGVEALARWRHAQRGWVSPVEFIPVAEASGLIGQIGRMVLDTACRDLAYLAQTLVPQKPFTMAVNLSRAQLRQASLATDVRDVLRDHGVTPAQLILEVTESLAAQDDVVQATLRELRALGVALALDDFGTGYSSLSCLHELPVNIVKVDRSFVMQAETSAYHRVLIEATIRMAQTLGLSTVAEGIETPEQAALMTALGCNKGQGYLFSKPLDLPTLTHWISARMFKGAGFEG